MPCLCGVWMCEVDVLKTGVTQHHAKIINICRETDVQHHLYNGNKQTLKEKHMDKMEIHR